MPSVRRTPRRFLGAGCHDRPWRMRRQAAPGHSRPGSAPAARNSRQVRHTWRTPAATLLAWQTRRDAREFTRGRFRAGVG